MTVAIPLFRKQLVEARWVLGLSSAALFGFSWLGVFFYARTQRRMGGRGAEAMIRRMISGDGQEITTGMIEVMFWTHPFVWLPLVAWAISRGSLAVAGELERGTMDLFLSRPVRRSTYMLSQVATAVVGLAVLASALLCGNLFSSRFNVVEGAPAAMDLARPALNFAVFGFCIFGVTLLFSALDIVRWRPTLIASSLTIASFASWIIASTVPILRGTEWERWLYRLSIFTAFNPVEAIGPAALFGRNLAILGGIGALGLTLALIVFSRRDLPSSAG